VVTDPGFDAPGPVANVGAVYLYRPNGTLISTVRGSSVEDRVGSSGVVVLTNGNYVVVSFSWNNGAIAGAGACPFLHSRTGAGLGTLQKSSGLLRNMSQAPGSASTISRLGCVDTSCGERSFAQGDAWRPNFSVRFD
jgi:hypothetical protein